MIIVLSFPGSAVAVEGRTVGVLAAATAVAEVGEVVVKDQVILVVMVGAGLVEEALAAVMITALIIHMLVKEDFLLQHKRLRMKTMARF
jgi:hypothetical protein